MLANNGRQNRKSTFPGLPTVKSLFKLIFSP